MVCCARARLLAQTVEQLCECISVYASTCVSGCNTFCAVFYNRRIIKILIQLYFSLQRSSICKAAIHAGVIKAEGFVDVLPLDKRKNYVGVLKNGIQSERYYSSPKVDYFYCNYVSQMRTVAH